MVSVKDKQLITNQSIGSISLCDSVNTIDLPFITDTTFNGDGFFFFGRYFGVEHAKVLAEFSQSSNPVIVNGIMTESQYFQTVQGISVNKTLNELVEAIPNIKFTAVFSGYEDLYFLKRSASSRIEFRVDRSSELEIYKLSFDDDIYGIDDVEGMRALVNRIGDIAKIRKITIVKTGV
jgi:hypothetical protein